MCCEKRRSILIDFIFRFYRNKDFLLRILELQNFRVGKYFFFKFFYNFIGSVDFYRLFIRNLVSGSIESVSYFLY